jgi:hypothetical protein
MNRVSMRVDPAKISPLLTPATRVAGDEAGDQDLTVRQFTERHSKLAQRRRQPAGGPAGGPVPADQRTFHLSPTQPADQRTGQISANGTSRRCAGTTAGRRTPNRSDQGAATLGSGGAGPGL